MLALATALVALSPTGLASLPIRSVDIMKWTKDTVARQPDDATIAALVDCLASMNLTHIAIAVPLDDSEDYPAAQKPSPRSAEKFAQYVCDAIHRRGLRVIHRGTWCGLEGLYGFAKRVGANRMPDGESLAPSASPTGSWLGKTYSYIVRHPGLFRDGDIWAPLPERTEGLFRDSESFLSSDGDGIRVNYSRFFIALADVSRAAFAKIHRKVRVGYSANNFSEIASGWLLPELPSAVGVVAFDHYGITHTPEELDSDLRHAFDRYGHIPLFQQEWGDYWNVGRPESERLAYLGSILGVLGKLADEKKLIGFNYWGGWQNEGEGIVVRNGDRFALGSRGRLLAHAFGAASTLAPLP